MRKSNRTAAKSSAQELVQSKGVPSGLDDFMGGYSTGEAVTDQSNEGSLVMHLKLMTKCSDVTKQKSLRAINSILEETEDAAMMSRYVSSIVTMVIKHSHHPNPLIRAGVYASLHNLTCKGKAVKQELAPELPKLAGPWIMATKDCERTVREEAEGALQDAFSPEKRNAMYRLYHEQIIEYCRRAVEEVVEGSGDAEGQDNVISSALEAVGSLMTQVSVCQAAVLSFMESPLMKKLLPESGAATGRQAKVALSSTLARCGVLTLLRNVVTVCPSSNVIHHLVARALEGSIGDQNVKTAQRVWELLLYWCRAKGSSIVGFFQPLFLDSVVDCIVKCNSEGLAEVIFPSVRPFLTQISKDSRCTGVIDEFCGALVEKVRAYVNATSLSSKELTIVVSALLSCWELHTARGITRRETKDSIELFTVITLVLSSVLNAWMTRSQRYLESISNVLAASLLKMLLHSSDVFRECANVLCEVESASFAVLPSSRNPSVPVEGFMALQSATVGQLCSQASNTTYLRSLGVVEHYFLLVVQRRIDNADAAGVATALQMSGGAFSPSVETVRCLVAWLVGQFTEWNEDSQTREALTPGVIDSFKCVLNTVLNWKDSEDEFPALIAAAQSLHDVPAIHDRVEDYLLKNDDVVLEKLVAACRDSAFHNISRYIDRITSKEGKASLTPELQRDILAAIGETVRSAYSSLLQSEESGSEEQIRSARLEDPDAGDGTDSDGASNTSTSGNDAKGNEICSLVIQWARILNPSDGSLGSLLGEVHSTFFNVVGRELLLLVSGISPCLYPEYYLSMKALQIAVENADDDLVDALESKGSYATTQQFQDAVASVQSLFTAFRIPQRAVDVWSESFWNGLLDGEPEIEGQSLHIMLLASHQLNQLIPFASPKLLVAIVSSQETWEAFQIPVVESAEVEQMFDGSYAINHMAISLYFSVRTAQMVRLLEFCNSHGMIPDIESNSAKGEEEMRALRVFLLLRTAMSREAFSTSIRVQMFKMLRFMILHLSPDGVACLAKLITQSGDPNSHRLICALGKVLSFLAKQLQPNEKVPFSQVVILLVSHMTEHIIAGTFDTPSASKLKDYSVFFQYLDQTADTLHLDLLSAVASEKESYFSSMFCELPSFSPQIVRMCLTIHRHLASKPEVKPITVKSLIQYAQRQSVIDGLEVLAELSCCRVTDSLSYGELVRSILHSMCRSYSLKHLPSNGRLLELSGQQKANSTSINLNHLWRVVLASMAARKGVILHNRADAVLRGSVNLVIFDCVCECVSHLRTATKEQVPQLARLVASTVLFLSSLQPDDISILRASEKSIHTIASMLAFVYLWVCATPVASLEAIGREVVSSVLKASCQLGMLTLVNSGIPLALQMESIITAPPTKSLRSRFSSSEPTKLRVFRRQNTLLRKTPKHRMALFPYLLGWCAVLTSSVQLDGNQVINRSNVCELLDTILVLMLSPAHPGLKGLEETYIAVVADEEEDVMKAASISDLCDTDSDYLLGSLARGSDALFRLLLQGQTLWIVKDWMNTLEKKAHDVVSQYVRSRISTALVKESLSEVLTHGEDGKSKFSFGESMTVEVSFATSSVSLAYEVEGEFLHVRILFPSDYPLTTPKIEFRNEKEYGVSLKKWRQWMMKMTAKLFGGGTNVWDCIVLFQRNVDAHFEGLEPCPICFAVVSVVDNRVPELACSVCRNSKFHGSCLYTWWSSGGSNVCPLCRSPWMS